MDEKDAAMRSREIPMSEAEFLRLPQDPGWMYEYRNGVARISPRRVVVPLRADVTPRAVDAAGLHLRPVAPADAPGLARAFYDGFHDTVEYCDWPDARIRQSGEDAIRTFFAGKRGAFHPASRLVLDPEQPCTVIGAALVVQKPNGPFLDMLFLRPPWQRHGLGSALAGAAMNHLHALGATHLGSALDLANAPSRRWHAKFGFVEQPNFALARVRAHAARHELWRRQEIGGLSGAERAALQAEAERWERLAASLDPVRCARGAAAGAP